MSNDPREPEVVLEVVGVSSPVLFANPPKSYLGGVNRYGGVTTRFSLTGDRVADINPDDLVISPVKAAESVATIISVDPVTEDGLLTEYRVAVRLDVSGHPEGLWSESFRIATGLSELEVVEIDMHGHIDTDIHFSNQLIQLQGPTSEEVVRVIGARWGQGGDGVLVSAEPELLDVRLEPVPGEEFVFDMHVVAKNVPAEEALDGPIQGTIHVSSQGGARGVVPYVWIR